MKAKTKVGELDPAKLHPADRICQKGTEACLSLIESLLHWTESSDVKLGKGDRVAIVNPRMNYTAEWAEAIFELQQRWHNGAPSLP